MTLLLDTLPYWVSYNLSPVSWIAMGVAFLAAMWLMGVWVWRMRGVADACRDDDEEIADPSFEAGLLYPPVSVIVSADSHSDDLPGLAESILAQEYPASFELIIVIEGGAHGREVTDCLHGMMLSHSNLYVTFVPEDSRSLSRRKLSLTLGIKAAQYEMLALTRGNCRISSRTWLRAMLRHAARGSEIIVGWAIPMQADTRQPGRLRRAYDTVWEAMTWLPRAISRRPYRATGCNLAYARHLFFDHKGFSHTLNIKSGDDDMFLYEIARDTRCSVELSRESMVEEISDDAARVHRTRKLEHFFTAQWLPKRPSLIMGSFSLAWWVMLLSGAFGAAAALPSYLGVALMVVLTLTTTIVCCRRWKNLSAFLGISSPVWSFPFLALWHPFYQLGYRVVAHFKRDKNYTWN